MIRPDTSLLSLIPLRLAAATLFGVACSPASEAPTYSGTGGTGSTTGGTGSTTGGFSSTTGGFSTVTGGVSNVTGGVTSTGGTATHTGGTTSTTGGTSATTGGTAVATGGTATTGGTTATTGGTATATGGSGGGSTCAGYDGTVATMSKIFTSGYGKATTGTWQGYAYTYTYGTGAVIKPGTSTTMSCFTAAQMCANGTVPGDDGAGVGIGWNISQPMGGTAAGAAITTPVKVTIAGAKANMRVSLGAATGTDEFCYTLTAADATTAATGLSIALTDFKQYCYDTAKATSYAGSMIKSIQVAVPGSKTDGMKTFDFCVVDVEPG